LSVHLEACPGVLGLFISRNTVSLSCVSRFAGFEMFPPQGFCLSPFSVALFLFLFPLVYFFFQGTYPFPFLLTWCKLRLIRFFPSDYIIPPSPLCDCQSCPVRSRFSASSYPFGLHASTSSPCFPHRNTLKLLTSCHVFIPDILPPPQCLSGFTLTKCDNHKGFFPLGPVTFRPTHWPSPVSPPDGVPFSCSVISEFCCPTPGPVPPLLLVSPLSKSSFLARQRYENSGAPNKLSLVYTPGNLFFDGLSQP